MVERKSSTLENGGTRASYGFRIRRAASSISPVIQDINGVDASLERDFKGLRQGVAFFLAPCFPPPWRSRCPARRRGGLTECVEAGDAWSVGEPAPGR